MLDVRVMGNNGLMLSVLSLTLMGFATSASGDGKVFARPEVQIRVETADQRAMIHFADGVEGLIIETSFLGEGTNFAWVVPLPTPPRIEPVSEGFFNGLQQAFQPRLIHYVHRYYLGVAFVCALGFLAWRSYKDETSWVVDLPLCLILAAGVGLVGRNFLIALITLAFVLYARLLTRSTTSVTLVVLVGMTLAAGVTFFNPMELGLIQTLGGEGGDSKQVPVTIVSVQRAGVFDATTLRSSDPHALVRWLERNGYVAPASIEPVVRSYVERGWVFVASKVRRENGGRDLVALHPLAFTFTNDTPVYPLKLTGVDNGDCTVDLYVFGQRRASARHFRAIRCDRVSQNTPLRRNASIQPGLRFTGLEAQSLIGNATIGTKLSAKLTPKQMKSDVEIRWTWFRSKGASVYSQSGALGVALNVGVILAVLGWFLIGSCRGGWDVDEASIRRWRWRLVLAAITVGLLVFLLLPKVEVVVAD